MSPRWGMAGGDTVSNVALLPGHILWAHTLLVSASWPHFFPSQMVTPMGTSYWLGRAGASRVEEGGSLWPSGSAS